MPQRYRYNELRREHDQLFFHNDFADIREIKGAWIDEKPNEPMLRVYRDSPGSVHLQVRTFAPITDKLARKPGKPRNMIATVSVGIKELEIILAYAKRELAPEEDRRTPRHQEAVGWPRQQDLDPVGRGSHHPGYL